MSLFDDLKAAIGPQWTAYTDHEFVRRLGEGTLPLAVFQDYLIQDYLFLVQFARANALAAYKSRNLADIEQAARGLSAILNETHLHRRLISEWGIDTHRLSTAPEKQATVAYTRYVLDCGMAGDLLDLQVALAPCTIGYAEIGTALAPALRTDPEHPYRDWIAEYAGEDFQRAAREATAHLDALCPQPPSPQRFAELTGIFHTASRLEADFWQQALDAA
ncbi:TenA family protein [Brachybacterium muris]|uniref:TenA family protein n=1 Tax=Brachybacterium muris TaxID=219301 RepID=UPI00195D8F35|nr:TenA family protein [Brachybacterium muris]MBM7501340.1 thiaminase/transcriptional activator TenA [Brachybacterium muris]MCT1431087.1 TenA family protein [Brachybacterium muris]MCT1997916.1 TenA family protein [Brachybacterium muris]